MGFSPCCNRQKKSAVRAPRSIETGEGLFKLHLKVAGCLASTTYAARATPAAAAGRNSCRRESWPGAPATRPPCRCGSSVPARRRAGDRESPPARPRSRGRGRRRSQVVELQLDDRGVLGNVAARVEGANFEADDLAPFVLRSHNHAGLPIAAILAVNAAASAGRCWSRDWLRFAQLVCGWLAFAALPIEDRLPRFVWPVVRMDSV